MCPDRNTPCFSKATPTQKKWAAPSPLAQTALCPSGVSAKDRCVQDSAANPAWPRRHHDPIVTHIPSPGECRAAAIHPTFQRTGPNINGVPAHALRHAVDGSGPIHDLQAHSQSAIPLPGSPRGTCRGLASQRTRCMERDAAGGIALSRHTQPGKMSQPIGSDPAGFYYDGKFPGAPMSTHCGPSA
jgi:hypothetical protein